MIILVLAIFIISMISIFYFKNKMLVKYKVEYLIKIICLEVEDGIRESYGLESNQPLMINNKELQSITMDVITRIESILKGNDKKYIDKNKDKLISIVSEILKYDLLKLNILYKGLKGDKDDDINKILIGTSSSRLNLYLKKSSLAICYNIQQTEILYDFGLSCYGLYASNEEYKKIIKNNIPYRNSTRFIKYL